MINRKNLGGGRCLRPTLQERGQALRLVSLSTSERGLRWFNTLKGGVKNG